MVRNRLPENIKPSEKHRPVTRHIKHPAAHTSNAAILNAEPMLHKVQLQSVLPAGRNRHYVMEMSKPMPFVKTTIADVGSITSETTEAAAEDVPFPHPNIAVRVRVRKMSYDDPDRKHAMLLWVVLCTNVTAGIGVLEQASPMIQELFKGAIGPVAAGGFVGLLSLFNMAERFFWASTSDFIGRKPTYFTFFSLGAVLYYFLPKTGADHLNRVGLFVAISAVLLSMYGDGFATIPAYLRDPFGTHHVSAIHGRLLTAWSVAGVLGPVLVNMRVYQIAHGADKTSAYQTVLHVMTCLLVIGFIANFLVHPVDQKYWMTESKSPSREGAMK